MEVNADVNIAIVVNNGSDNYIWVKNTGSADADITIASVSFNGSSVSSSDIHIAGGSMTVAAGDTIEIGIICNSTGAFITSRNDL